MRTIPGSTRGSRAWLDQATHFPPSELFTLSTRSWLSTLALSCCLCICTLAQTAPISETRQAETIAPGIEHLAIKRGNFEVEQSDRWLIHVLIVDPQLVRLQLGIAMDEVVGSELTSSLATRHGALAAINGGYFRTMGVYRGEQVGTLILRGRVLSEPVRGRVSLALRETGRQIQAAVVNVTLKAELRINRQQSLAVNGFNRLREKDELIVFTPEFHRTTLTAPDGVEAIVRRGRVVAVHDARGSQAIPPDGLVLSAHGTARTWLLANVKRGARVELKTAINTKPTLSSQPDFILGGGPRLLTGGQSTIESEAADYAASFFTARHPRTALGWRGDGKLVLVTVDGRQPQKSVGMTIAELANLMLELDCVEALNLDGGGSTTMVIRNKVVNSPSDATGERAVSDALLFLPREAKTR